MVIRMRATRAHRDNRRSHHALKITNLAKCENCGTKRVNHTICKNCGRYKGKMVVDVAGKSAKKAERRKKREKSVNK